MKRFDRYLHIVLLVGTLYFGAFAVLLALDEEWARAAFYMALAVWVDPT